eukprot:8079256-Pyramimonas_sp.AAC.1
MSVSSPNGTVGGPDGYTTWQAPLGSPWVPDWFSHWEYSGSPPAIGSQAPPAPVTFLTEEADIR